MELEKKVVEQHYWNSRKYFFKFFGSCLCGDGMLSCHFNS